MVKVLVVCAVVACAVFLGKKLYKKLKG